MEVLHPKALRLVALWNRWRGSKPMPARSELVMAEMKDILPFIMIIERHPVRDLFTLRLAGTALRRFTAREMTGSDISELWSRADAERVIAGLRRVVADAEIANFSIEGATEAGRTLSFEALLLPVQVDGRRTIQILSALLPLNEPFWLGSQPIVGFRVLAAQSLAISQHLRKVDLVS